MIEESIIRQSVASYLAESHISRLDLKAVMFDMDGVLFDSMKYHSASWHETMKHFGMNLPREEAYMHEGRTGASTINIVSRRDRGHEATQEEIEKIYAYKAQLFNQYPEAQPMEGAKELLNKVKASGLIPILVTGSGQKSLLSRLESNFPGIFTPEHAVTSFDVKYGKPDPEPYLMGMKKGGNLSPQNAIVVENAPLGIEAGHKSGCFTIAVNTGPLPDEVLMEAGANLLYPSMEQLNNDWERLLPILQTSMI